MEPFLGSIPASLFSPIGLCVPHSLNKYRFITSIAPQQTDSLFLTLLGPLLSHIHFRISLLTGTKKNLLKTCWDYFKIFRSIWAGTDIFTMLSLPIHKYSISIFYLSTLISLNIILSTEVLHIFGLFSSRYFSFFKISHSCSTAVTV